MTVRRSTAPLITLGLLSACACANDIDKPPPPECTGSCGRSGVPPSTGSRGENLDAGDAQSDARADASPSVDGGAAVTVVGTVQVLQNETFATSTEFVGRAEVGMDGPNGRVATQIDGALYVLDGVERGESVWADLQPISTLLDVPTTIENVNTATLDGVVPLFFARTAVMESIAQNLSTPVELDPTRAQAIVFFLDAQGFGISGFRLTAHPGQVAAYDDGSGIFRDDLEATTESGLVVILDVPALEFPGGLVQIAYAGTTSGTAEMKIAQGAVTLVAVDVFP